LRTEKFYGTQVMMAGASASQNIKQSQKDAGAAKAAFCPSGILQGFRK
jgi:hypothetical protein